MKQLTLNIDDAAFQSAESVARQSGQSVASLLLGWLKRVSSSAETEFDRLLREEEALREKLLQSGRQFAASSRLPRDELHDRHALR
ncbi:MAG: hypothetical protein IPK22_13910 [Verrucomicrobiaceae bacterium]|nr:hypothetical protein [Verrucomicrobiaceae bacterium]